MLASENVLNVTSVSYVPMYFSVSFDVSVKTVEEGERKPLNEQVIPKCQQGGCWCDFYFWDDDE